MKPLNVLGAVTRYLLAAVSCISLAQFLLLLNVGTESAGRLAGQVLGRGVITGLVAAVWFYRARKVRPPAPANLQTQVQAAPLPSSQAQRNAPPLDSISATAPTSVPITDHSSSSFWREHRGFVGLIAGVAVVLVVGALASGGMFQQFWTLGAGTSQPRFVHVQGTPGPQMFDNKTAQTCWSGPVVYDSVDEVERDMHFKVHDDQSNELEKKCNIEKTWNCFDSAKVDTATDSLITELLADSKPRLDPPKSDFPDLLEGLFKTRSEYPQYKEFYDRYDAIMTSPDRPPIYRWKDGMPYCSELVKKWW